VHCNKIIKTRYGDIDDLITDDFGTTKAGCKAVINVEECCQLAAQYWPRALSWTYIRDGEGPYVGMMKYCCLHTSYRVNPIADEKTDAGYSEKRCTLGANCDISVWSTVAGGGLTQSDLESGGIVIQENECGSGGTRKDWTFFDNTGTVRPTVTPTSIGLEAVYTMTSDHPRGAPGTFFLCYKGNNPVEADDFTIPVGAFTMRGPYTGQHFECTFGVECVVSLNGYQLSPDTILPNLYVEAKMGILLIDNNEDCGIDAPTAPVFRAFQNPDNVEDNFYDKDFRMGAALMGPTAVNFKICYGASPDCTDDGSGGMQCTPNTYRFPIGTFMMNGPSAADSVCDISVLCVITVVGTGLANTNAVVILRGFDQTWCGAYDVTVGSLGNNNDNPKLVVDDGTWHTFNVGYLEKGHQNKPGPDYKVCWSGVPLGQLPPTCTSTTCKMSYNIEIGRMTLRGPKQKDYHCKMTKECTLDVTGYMIAKVSSILFLPSSSTCGEVSPTFPDWVGVIGGAVSWEPKVNPLVEGDFVSEDHADVARYEFGVPTGGITAIDFRICFSQTGATTGDHRTELGTLIMSGPFVEPSPFTCTMGITCMVTIDGAALAGQNKLVMLKQGECGSSTDLVDFAPFTPNPGVQGDFKTYNFGRCTDGVPGTYTICWAYEDLAGLTEYKFRVGQVTMRGPYAAATGCILSLPCSFTLAGVLLEEGNEVTILKKDQTCGANGAQKANWANMVEVKKADSSLLYSFGTPTQGAPGEYKLCFAFLDTEDPIVNVGTFTMSGPTHPRLYECRLTKLCSITLEGVNLVTTNKVAIKLATDSCGDNAAAVVFRDVTNPQTVSVGTSGKFDYYEFGISSSGLPGTYRLCWGQNPSSIADYNVDLGDLVVYGAGTLGLSTCTLGLPCPVRIMGLGLIHDNALAIVSQDVNCNTDIAAGIVPFEGAPNPVKVDSQDVELYTFGLPTQGVPGIYKLCWADDGVSMSTTSFTLYIGEFRMIGPDQTPKLCILSRECNIPLTGEGIHGLNSILLIDRTSNCGDPNPEVAFFRGITNPLRSTLVGTDRLGGNFVEYTNDLYKTGTGRTGLVGVVAKVCWSDEPNTLNEYQDYKVTVGLFTMEGPRQRVSIVASVTFSDIAGPITATLESGAVVTAHRQTSKGDLWDVETGTYKGWRLFELHLTNNPSGTMLSGNARGPQDQTWWFEFRDENVACTLGQPCNAFLEGVGLVATNQLLIITSKSSCGDPTPELSNMLGIDNPRLVSDDDFDNQYNFGLVTVGGSYSRCRVSDPANTCIGSHYRLCWAYNPSGKSDFVVQVGIFEMKGPFVTFATQCMLGLPCSIRLYGTGFTLTNRVLIVPKTSECGRPDMQISGFSGLTNPQLCSFASEDGKESMFSLGIGSSGVEGDYKLCWGFKPLVMQQYNIEIGPFKFEGQGEGCWIENDVTLKCSA